MEHQLITTVLFVGGFLLITALLQEFTKRIKFPYTVALLMMGFLGQLLVHRLHLDLHIDLPSNITFFILLPALLFGAAMHINFHQFKLQFKTISFAATFGLLLSVFAIAFMLPLFIGLPFEVALLFGALISSTDPIAVLALFNTLGAPRRLALLADGESMFNDATGVIAFRIVSAVVLGGAAFTQATLMSAVGNFLYIFIGSIVAGAIIGYLTSLIISYIHNDALVETTLTLGAALLAFAGAEHFFHLSGVITSVIAGLVVGNLGRSKFSAEVVSFIREFWDYLGFLAVSFVFFFATFHLDIGLFFHNPSRWMLAVLAVLIGRAISVYGGYLISNKLPLFKDEPNVPMSWQHILNWGGLRGVIPLVLIFTIPEDYAYRDELFVFTLASLLFTLFVNGLTIEWLLKKLGLHLPAKEEAILNEEHSLFDIDISKQKLQELSGSEFSKSQVKALAEELETSEREHKDKLLTLANSKEFENSLRLEMLNLERQETERLFKEGYISENVLYDFDAQLDLQQDALEYPEVFEGRGFTSGGKIQTRQSFRRQVLNLRKLLKQFPIISFFSSFSEDDLVIERFSLLKARLLASEAVLEYLDRVEHIVGKNGASATIAKVRQEHQKFIVQNQDEINQIKEKYGQVVSQYQEDLLRKLVYAREESFLSSH